MQKVGEMQKKKKSKLTRQERDLQESQLIIVKEETDSAHGCANVAAVAWITFASRICAGI